MYTPNQGKRSGGGWKGGNKFGQNKPWDRGFGGQGSSRPPMFKATCAECGDPCEVPFRPSAGRPVFCSNCFKKDENAGPQRFDRMDRKPSFEDRQMYNAVCAKCSKNCEVPFRPTGAKPIYCKQCLGTISAPENRSVEITEQFKAVNAKLDAILKALGQSAPTVKTVEKTPAKEIKKVEEVKEAVISKKTEIETPKKAAKAKAPAKKAKKKGA